jgi:hypothetical protein
VPGWIHPVLDGAGAIPGIGEPVDCAHAIILLLEGNYGEAGLTACAMIPILGEIGKGLKYADEAYDIGKGIFKIPIRKGLGKAPQKGPPNGIYEQIDPNTGKVRSRTYYDENGNRFGRQDFEPGHGKDGPHEHSYDIDPDTGHNRRGKGQDNPRDLPPGYDDTPTRDDG